MKPVITSRPISDYPLKRQKELCTCLKRCKNVILIVRDDFAYQVCEKGTQEFAYEMLKEVGRVGDPSRLRVNHWTVMEIQQLKDYVNSFGGGVPHGAYSEFAKLLNKTRIQVRDQVSLLRKRGELPPATPGSGGRGKKK